MQPGLRVEFSLNYLKAEISEEFEENNAGVVKSGCAHLMFPGSDMSGWGEEEEEGAQHENTQFGSGGQGRGEDGLSDKYRKKSGSKKKGPATFARWLRGI